MIVACLQPKFHGTRDKCYNEVETLTKQLKSDYENCQLACLPERWVPFLEDIPSNFQKERGEDYSFIKDLAKEYNLSFLTGAIWEKRNNSNKPFITCYYLNENGEEIGRQDKIHLYAYERGEFEPGKELHIFKYENYHFAVLICFDMAFYETPRFAIENGADLLLSPTQIRQDGMENWKIYLTARALENRVPVAACNALGQISDRIFLGNSKIISFQKGFRSPSKLIIKEAPSGSSDYICEDIDLKFPRKLRRVRLKEKVDISKIRCIKY
ncbi:MAG: carbon-nitrogen hydrolase family protein [Promethearchaeota archaeon]